MYPEISERKNDFLLTPGGRKLCMRCGNIRMPRCGMANGEQLNENGCKPSSSSLANCGSRDLRPVLIGWTSSAGLHRTSTVLSHRHRLQGLKAGCRLPRYRAAVAKTWHHESGILCPTDNRWMN